MAAEIRSFTSFQMVHTHASLPRGFFAGDRCKLMLLLVPWTRISQDQKVANQNTGKNQIRIRIHSEM